MVNMNIIFNFNFKEQESYYQKLVEDGIMDWQSAEEKKMTKFEKEVKDFLQVEKLNIKFQPSQNVYRLVIPPKGIESGLKKYYYGRTEDLVLQNLYDNIKKLSNKTLEGVYSEWHNERLADADVSVTTNRHDQNYWEKYFQGTEIAKMEISKIDQRILSDKFRDMTKGRTMFRKEFTNVKSMLNYVFDYAVVQGYIKDNLCRPIKPHLFKFKAGSNLDKVYTWEERTMILNALKNSSNVYDLAICLMFCLGCRVGEVKALHWEDINFQNSGKVYIHREIITSGKSQNKQTEVDHTKSGQTEGNREIPIGKTTQEILDRIKECSFDDTYLFLGKNGGFLLTQQLNKHLKDVCEKLGIPYFPSHKIRATVATEMIRNGMDEVTAMYTFGWADPKTAKCYVRPLRTKTSQLDLFDKII